MSRRTIRTASCTGLPMARSSRSSPGHFSSARGSTVAPVRATGTTGSVLAVVLAGLLSSNVLITVFVVALPSVAAGLHTSVATITWVVTAPDAGGGCRRPARGKAERQVGPSPALPGGNDRKRGGRCDVSARS